VHDLDAGDDVAEQHSRWPATVIASPRAPGRRRLRDARPRARRERHEANSDLLTAFTTRRRRHRRQGRPWISVRLFAELVVFSGQPAVRRGEDLQHSELLDEALAWARVLLEGVRSAVSSSSRCVSSRAPARSLRSRARKPPTLLVLVAAAARSRSPACERGSADLVHTSACSAGGVRRNLEVLAAERRSCRCGRAPLRRGAPPAWRASRPLLVARVSSHGRAERGLPRRRAGAARGRRSCGRRGRDRERCEELFERRPARGSVRSLSSGSSVVSTSSSTQTVVGVRLRHAAVPRLLPGRRARCPACYSPASASASPSPPRAHPRPRRAPRAQPHDGSASTHAS